MEAVRVGIIGCGVIAPTHVESYRKLEGVEVLWACDLIEDRAKQLAEKYGIPKTTTDYRKVVRDRKVTAISVCTDHASHAPITVAGLKKGKHVLCEKALTSSAKGLNAMMRAHAKKQDLVFEGVFQHRFDPIFQTMKGLLDKGTLGRMLTAGVQVRCKRTNEYYNSEAWRGTWAQEGGAVLINQAIHFIDMLVWLMDGVESVGGVYENLTHQGVIETEDTATAALRFRNGALGILEATCSSHLDWEQTLSFHGTEGSIDIRNGRPMKIQFLDKAREAEVAAGFEAAVNAPGEALGKSYYGTGHPAQMADFVASIRERRAPFIPALSARHTVDVVLALYESHRKGKWIKTPVL